MKESFNYWAPQAQVVNNKSPQIATRITGCKIDLGVKHWAAGPNISLSSCVLPPNKLGPQGSFYLPPPFMLPAQSIGPWAQLVVL